MRQALHIFKKDVRALRVEIVLLLALAALLGWTETALPAASAIAETLVVLVVNYVIARVVHAEAIPGHNQFWITRPYRWKSLLGAKILFIAAFVNLPVFAAQCYMLTAGKFSFAASLPGLVWSQVLMILCISLPATCLASLTTGIVPYLLAEFALLSAVFIVEAVHVRTQWGLLAALQAGPAAVDWVRDSLALMILAAAAIFVLRSQYKTRRTDFGDKCAIAGAAAAAVVFLCVPWTFALGVQSELSSQPFDASSLKLALISVAKSVFPPHGRGLNPPGEVSFPIVVSGIRDGQELEADALSISLTAADGKTWNSGYVTPVIVESGSGGGPGETLIDGILHVDPAFFAAETAHPVTMRIRLHLTAFGDPHSITIPIQPEPVNAVDGLQCSAGLFNQLYCKSIFRWPRRRVYAMTGEGGVESHIRLVSYSPFPATLGFIPIEQHSFSGEKSATQATILTKAPLSHFHVDAEIAGLSLADWTPEAKRKALTPPTAHAPGSRHVPKQNGNATLVAYAAKAARPKK